MPYAGVPDHLTKKMDSCVSQVMAKEPGTSKSSAVAICKSRIVPKTERSAGDVHSRPVQSPIRSIGNGRYECYAVAFNGPDDKDLFNTYFDQTTRYYLDYYKSRPWLYEHGLHPSVGRFKVGDWDEAGMDDNGVFVRGELDAHHRHRARIEALIAAKVLYPSSGAVSRTVRVADDGHVEDWAIDEVSSTVRPADWRMLETINPVARIAMRSMLDEYITEVNTMGLKDELLAFLGSASTDARSDGADADTLDDAQPLECKCDGECTCNLAQDVLGQSTDADAGGASADDASPDVVSEELVRNLAETIGVELATIRTAIINLDVAVKEQDASLQEHATLLTGLATEETERTQRAMQDGSWVQDLYTASRSDGTPVANGGEVDDAKRTPAPAAGTATAWERVSGQVQ